MFACFEIMRGHHGIALTHIRSAIKIIAELQSQHIGNNASTATSTNGLVIPTFPLIPMETLTTLFTRLDSQVSELQAVRSENILTPSTTYEPGFSPVIPKKFTTIAEARNCFEYLYNGAIHENEAMYGLDVKEFHEDDEEVIDCVTADVLNKFAKWKLALNAFLKDPATRLDGKGKQAINMLDLRQTVVTQVFCASGIKGECVWDTLTEEHESIIDLCESILSSTSSPSPSCISGTPQSILPQRTFSLDPGLVVPLFNTIWKCRVSSLRRRGIRLLKQYPRQEGVWDGVLVAIACERIVAIEEEGMGEIFDPSDLPEWKRVLDVGVEFDLEGKKGVLSYEKMKGREGSERVKIQDDLFW